MKTLEKIINTLARNLGQTVVLVLAIALFAIFSDGLIGGLITAGSALVAYASATMLYRDFKSAPAAKKPAKKK